jgi:hypothetical protein
MVQFVYITPEYPVGMMWKMMRSVDYRKSILQVVTVDASLMVDHFGKRRKKDVRWQTWPSRVLNPPAKYTLCRVYYWTCIRTSRKFLVTVRRLQDLQGWQA